MPDADPDFNEALDTAVEDAPVDLDALELAGSKDADPDTVLSGAGRQSCWICISSWKCKTINFHGHLVGTSSWK